MPVRARPPAALLGLVAVVGLLGALGLAGSGPAAADVPVVETYDRPVDGVFTVDGHGWGHGRGMSQWGAQGAARAGIDADTITATYYPGTAKASLPDAPIRVLLSDDGVDTDVVAVPGLVATDLATGAVLPLPGGPARWRVVADPAGLHLQRLDGVTWSTTALGATTSPAGPVSFSGPTWVRLRRPDGSVRDYRGAVRSVRSGASTVSSVDVIGLEDYLLGVVPQEAVSSWLPAALQAQAIAARSYSAYKRAHAPAGGAADICDTTSCQVFAGTRTTSPSGAVTTTEQASTTAAVQATATVVRTYGGAPVFAEFSSSNGGWSTAGSAPYLVARQDDWDGLAPNSVHSWTGVVRAADLEARFPALGTLTRLSVTARDGNGEWGGRVRSVLLEGVTADGRPTSVSTDGAGVYGAATWPARSDGLRSTWWHVRGAPAPVLTVVARPGPGPAVLQRSPAMVSTVGGAADPAQSRIRPQTPGPAPVAAPGQVPAPPPAQRPTGSVPCVQVGVLLEQCLSPVPGGTGRYSREVAAALARTSEPGAVSGVTALHRDVSAAVVPGVDGPHRLALPRRALVAAWAAGLGPLVPALLLLAPTPLAPPRRRRRPLVVTVHDAVPWTHPETLTPRGVRWHRSAVARAARTADLLVVPTHAVAAELCRHVAVADDRLLVVGEGVSGSLALPADAADRAVRLALPERFLLTVATLEPRKGLAELVAALAHPLAPDLPLLCVGQPGWGGQDPERLAAEAGLPPGRVRALGRVPDADLAVLLARAEALVVPSLAEGFGLPLLEGMAAGTPVLTSTDPALVEVAGGAALSSPLDAAALAAALARVVDDAGLRTRLRADGPVRARSYTWDGAAERLWQAFDGLVPGLRRAQA